MASPLVCAQLSAVCTQLRIDAAIVSYRATPLVVSELLRRFGTARAAALRCVCSFGLPVSDQPRFKAGCSEFPASAALLGSC
eukprot:6201908-Pleurochrysis_carterae.AAC.4